MRNKYCLRALCALFALALAAPAGASRTKVHRLHDYAGFAAGEFEGTSLDADGAVRLGPELVALAEELSGPVLSVVRGGDGAVYAATAAPGRVWRVAAGKEPTLLADLKKPLVTALVPFGPSTLVALSAPDGDAHFLDLKTGKETRTVGVDDVKLLLGGAAAGGTLYAVGGGEEGVLLRLRPGAESFETLARVGEKHLRSVAVGRSRGAGKGPLVVAGGGDDGVLYAYEGDRLRALVDPGPSEVTDIVIDRRGHVFAALVDADGKLSSGATKRDEEEDDGKKKGKPRKVKSAEVIRVTPDGKAEVLWQSKAHGAYALALSNGRLLLATGARGRIYDLDPAGKRKAGVLARVEGRDEVTSLFSQRDGSLLVGTAHGGGVFQLSTRERKKGAYLTKAFDAGSLARYGTVRSDLSREGDAAVRVQLRTGNTKEPDDTWSPFSTALLEGGVPNAPPGRYAQLRYELVSGKGGTPSLGGARLSYLKDNRPPEIARVEVLMPGWKVVGTTRDAEYSRSVTMSEKPFSKYLERSGSRLPSLGTRPSGKQTWQPGWRTIYAWVEDPDKDALRYRFSLGEVGAGGEVRDWLPLKGWSEEPFYSFEAARLADGRYRVKVEVDDAPSNGSVRAEGESALSPPFQVAHARPAFEGASATRSSDGYRVRFTVKAGLPLAAVRCSPGGDDWLPVDATDGIVDSELERFETSLPSERRFSSVSCEATDEGGNHSRVDLPVGR